MLPNTVLGRGIRPASTGAGVRLLQGRRSTDLLWRPSGWRADLGLPESTRERSHRRLCERVEKSKGPHGEVSSATRAVSDDRPPGRSSPAFWAARSFPDG